MIIVIADNKYISHTIYTSIIIKIKYTQAKYFTLK